MVPTPSARRSCGPSSLDKVKEHLAVDGISGSALGGQIIISINGTLAAACSSETTRFLSLTKGRVEVV